MFAGTHAYRFSIGAAAIAAAALLGSCATPPPPLEVACARLLHADVPNGRVNRVAWVEAGKTRVTMRTAQPEFEVPRHCDLWGRINERTGVDGKLYFMGFNLRLPADWNGRFLFQGGGGTDGVIREAVGLLPGGGQSAGALARGFAVVSTDAGHQNEPGPAGEYLFGLEPRARLELGYAHLPAVNAAALAIIGQAYGRAPHHKYFVGCSNGGRQGMMAAQRYGQMFDGIIAGAPAYRVPYAAAEATQQTQLLAGIAPKAANGKPLLGSALTRDELKTVADRVLETCDALDGLRDGMIQNVQACKFDAAALACKPGESARCLSPAKAAVVGKLFDGARLANGNRIYSDWPWDPGINHPGWIAWRLGMNATAMPPNAINASLIPGSLAYVFTTPPDQPKDLYDYALSYNADAGVPKIAQSAGIFTQSAEEFNNPTSPDLDRFTRNGGRILFFHGMADPIFSATDTVRYVQQLQERESAAKFALYGRLYLVPGMTHCSGGPATDKFEMLQPLVDWVEKGQSPASIVAEAGPGSPWPKRTRPLCPWPQQAFHGGAGNPEDAASFVCR